MNHPARLTLYAAKDNQGNVLIFRDRSQSNESHICTVGHWKAYKPTRRNRWIYINCFRWRLERMELV